ncbi:UNVERIFIED_CONTAM: hypothetical protein K2H54_004882 [Gekko kuhli]
MDFKKFYSPIPGRVSLECVDRVLSNDITPSLLRCETSQKSLPLEWDSTYGHAFLSGVRYKNKGLVIDEPGVYFVYSKVFFRGQHCSNQPLDHVVFKQSPVYSGSQVLMEDRKMNYCTSMRMWSRSSYLGALFNLSRQDSLYVNVSQFTLVNYEESKTFFGLYML